MSFASALPQDEIRTEFIPGRVPLGTHISNTVKHTLYDLPWENIQRASELFFDDIAGSPYIENEYDPGYIMSPEAANEEFGLNGAVTFDKPISRGKAERISRYKREELERVDTLALGSDTGFRKVVGFGASLAAQALDPINLGLMLIPIANEATFAKLVTKYGLTKARLIAHSMETIGGNLMAEPFSYLSKAMGEQNLYDLEDTLTNVSMGFVMGLGLRMGGGKLKDMAFGKYNPLDYYDQVSRTKLKDDLKNIKKGIKRDVTREAKEAGLKKGTPEYKEFIKNKTRISMEMDKARITELQEALVKLDPHYHRYAFEEALNNIIRDEPIASPKTYFDAETVIETKNSMKVHNAKMKSDAVVEAVIEEIATNPDTVVPRKVVTPDADINIQRPATKAGKTLVDYNNTRFEIKETAKGIRINFIEKGDESDLLGLMYNFLERAYADGKSVTVDGHRWTPDDIKLYMEANRGVMGIEVPGLRAVDSDVKTPVSIDRVTSTDESLRPRVNTPEELAKKKKLLNDLEVESQQALDDLRAKLHAENAENMREDFKRLTGEDPMNMNKSDIQAELERIIKELPEETRNEIIEIVSESQDRLKIEHASIDAAISCVLSNLG